MAALYVSGDTDYSQGVDAGQAKEQREEPIHLEGQRTQPVSPTHPQISPLVCLIAPVSFSRSGIPAFFFFSTKFAPDAGYFLRSVSQDPEIKTETFITVCYFLHNSLIEFRVWGDYLLIMALVKGNYATGVGSGSNHDAAHPAVPFPGDMDQLRSS